MNIMKIIDSLIFVITIFTSSSILFVSSSLYLKIISIIAISVISYRVGLSHGGCENKN